MKNKITVLLFIFTTLSFGQESIKVVTYNLMGMKPGTNWEERLEHIIMEFEIIDPDIIGLQEINESQGFGADDNMAQTIADSLEAYFNTSYYVYYEVTHTSWGQFDESVGIISKYPVIAYGYSSLTPGVFPRKVVWNYILSPVGWINFFNTHLSYLDDHNYIRVQQVQEIMEFITEKENIYDGFATILTGDFNCIPGSDPYNLLVDDSTGIYFLDSWDELNPGNPGYTYSSDNPHKRIDFIFYKNTGDLQMVSSQLIMTDPYNGSDYPSDHFGVMTLFSESGASTDEYRDMTPNEFHLYENFPNPFNPMTTIEFDLPIATEVELLVFDIVGHKIAVLANGLFPPGSHKLMWNAESFPSGIYYYRLKTDNYIAVRKCLLLK